MSVTEHLDVFLSIVLGLAITDLCVSLNRLLGAGSRVRWDWLAPMAALLALLKIFTQWWQWFSAGQLAAKAITFELFALVMTGGVLMFLMAAAALPDRADEAVVDLRGYYAGAARRYWLLFTAQYLAIRAVSLWIALEVLHAAPTWPDHIATIITCAVALTLAFVRNRGLQTLGLAAFIALYSLQLVGHVLAGS